VAELLADAAHRAGRLAGPAPNDSLAATKTCRGVTGQLTLDPQHNPVKSAVILRVDTPRGKTTFPVAATINPAPGNR
jgi:branched-chain amino acid transport system substrate-binding protein